MMETIGGQTSAVPIVGSPRVLSSNLISATALETFLSHVDVASLLEDLILHPVSDPPPPSPSCDLTVSFISQIKVDAARLSSWISPRQKISTPADNSAAPRNSERVKRTFQEISLDPQAASAVSSGPFFQSGASSSQRIKKSREDIEVEAFCGGAQAG
jgi:hypothetical protein